MMACMKVAIDTNVIHYKSIILTGTTGSTQAQYARVMALVAGGRIDTASLVSGRFPLSSIQDVFEHAATGEGLKTLVVPGE